MTRYSPGDIKEVCRIMLDIAVLPHITDDGQANCDIQLLASRLLDRVDVYTLCPRPGNLVIFVPENSITYAVHVMSVPGPGRKKIMSDAKAAVLWMMDRGAKKIIAKIPQYNRPARMAAIMCGMKKEGTLEKMWEKWGRLWNVDVFGATSDMKGV